jgi:hypothetical protein
VLFFLLFILCYFTVSTERVSALDNSALPGVRDISNAVFKATDTETPGEGFNTLMSLNWGQFLDHDIVLTPTYTGKCLNINFRENRRDNMKNGQSRDTGNIVHRRHKMKTNNINTRK